MTHFYSDKDSLYVANEIIHDADLALTAVGVFLVMAANKEKYYSVEDLCQHEDDDISEIEEGLEQLLDRKLIRKKGWKYIINQK